MIPRRIVLLTALLLAVTACHHVDKKEQLAALDDAYKAGLLTKDEYEAKKQAITGETPLPTPVVTPAPSAQPASPEPAATAVPATVANPAPAPTPTVHARSRSHAHSSVSESAAAPVVSSTAPVAVAPKEPSTQPTNSHSNEPAPLPGCEDAEYKSGGQKGPEERFFAAPPDKVRNAALSALDSLDFNIHKKSNKEIEASKKRHMGAIVGAGGERVILKFEASERKGIDGTRVTGETKKNFIGHVSQRTWTDAVLAEIACKLSESSN